MFKLIVNKLDEIAWLFDIRCLNQIPFNPLFYSFLIIEKTKDNYILNLYIDLEDKSFFSKSLLSKIFEFKNKVALNIKDYIDLYYDLQKLNNMVNDMDLNKNSNNNEIGSINENSEIIFNNTINTEIYSKIKDKNIVSSNVSCIEQIKCIKTNEELLKMKKAYIMDGLAFLIMNYILHSKICVNNELISEVEVSKLLYQIRNTLPGFKMESFSTISSFSSNSSIVHYSPKIGNCKNLNKSDIFLLDAGAHYEFGTTDTTRVFHFGNPSKFNKEIYTRVLQGNLALERSLIKIGDVNSSKKLDYSARLYLNRLNFDYGHSTGHGVGCFLNVHEGPISISSNSNVIIKEGMTFSNEPGCYFENQFGVRIENVLEVKKKSKILDHEYNHEYLYLNNLTRFPYEKNLLDLEILSKNDVEYVNSYHELIKKDLSSEILKISTNEKLFNISTSSLIDFLNSKTSKI